MPTVQELRVALTPDLAALKAGLLESRRSLAGVASEAAVTEKEITAAAKRAAGSMARDLVDAGKEGAAAFRQVSASVKSAEAEWASFAREIETGSAQAFGAMRKEVEATSQSVSELSEYMRLSVLQQFGQSIEQGGRKVLDTLKEFVTAGSDVQQTLLDIRGNTLLTNEQFERVSATIKKVGSETPVPLEELSKAMLRITNEGFQGADAMKVFEAATKAAVSTGAKAGDVANILASTLVTLGLGAGDAARVMNELHVAAALGNATLQQFAEHSGKAHSVAHQFGVELADVDSALSTLTRHGFDAAKAETGVVGMMVKIANPTKQALTLIEQVSRATGVDLVNSFSAAGLRAEGLLGVLGKIRQAAEALRVNPSDLATKLIAAQRGGIQAGELVTPGTFRDLQLERKQLDATMAGAFAPIDAQYTERLKTFGAQLEILRNEFKLIGSDLLEVFGPALKDIAGFVHDLAEGFRALSPQTQSFIGWTTAAAGGLALVTGKAIELLTQIALIKLALGTGGIAGLFGKGAVAAGEAGGAGAAGSQAGPVGIAAAVAALMSGGQFGAGYRGAQAGQGFLGGAGSFLGIQTVPGSLGWAAGKIPGLRDWLKPWLGSGGPAGGARAAGPEAPGPEAGLSSPVAAGTGEEMRNVRDALAGPPKDVLAFAAASEALKAKLIDLNEALKGNANSLAALKLRYPDVTAEQLKAFRADQLAVEGIQQQIAARKKAAEELKRQQEQAAKAHADAAAFITAENEATTALTSSMTKGADALAEFRRQHKGWTEQDVQGTFAAKQAHEAATKAINDRTEATKKAAKATEDAAHNAATRLQEMGRRTTEALGGTVGELAKAAGEFNLLRGADLSGVFSAEHLGLSPGTLAAMERANSLLVGIRNASQLMNQVLEGPRSAALAALGRFADTRGLASEQAGLLNQAVAWLRQNAPQRGIAPGSLAGLSPEQLRAAGESATPDAQRAGAFETLRANMPQALREALERAVGDLRPFFGQIPATAKTVFEQWGTQLQAAAKEFEKDAGESFALFRDGLTHSLEFLDMQIEEFGKYLSRAAQGAQFSGARAGGGPVSAGGTYLVGERGPELFVPSGNGSIVPNGRGGAVHVTMNIATPDVHSFRRSQAQIATDMHRALEYARARSGG